MLIFSLVFLVMIWCIAGTIHALYRSDSQIRIQTVGKYLVVYFVEGPLVWIGLPVLWLVMHVVEFVFEVAEPLVTRFEKWYQE